MTLSEYDAATSPSDPKRYNEITRMTVPQVLTDKLKAIRETSSGQERGIAAVSQEDLRKFIDDAKNELQLHPLNPELRHALAVAYFAKGLFLSSEENFLEARKGKPTDAHLPYNLGILYYSAYHRLKAESAWQESLRLDSTMGTAHLNLSYLYYESAQYSLAWEHCQKARELGISVPSDLVTEIRRKIP